MRGGGYVTRYALRDTCASLASIWSCVYKTRVTRGGAEAADTLQDTREETRVSGLAGA